MDKVMHLWFAKVGDVLCNLWKMLRILWLVRLGLSTMPSNCTSGVIRLSGEQSPVSGRLEICINQAWGTLCNYQWDVRDARVACSELGFQQLYGKLLFKMILFMVACSLRHSVHNDSQVLLSVYPLLTMLVLEVVQSFNTELTALAQNLLLTHAALWSII